MEQQQEYWREKVVRYLKNRKEGAAYRELFFKCGGKDKDRTAFSTALDGLVREGVIYERNARFFDPAAIGMFTATVVKVNRTFGFVRETLEDGTTQDYFVPGRFFLGALPGDTVLCRKLPGRGESPEGQIDRILAQGSSEFTGALIRKDGRWFIHPDKLMKDDLPMANVQVQGYHEGDKVLARITHRGHRHSEHRAEIVAGFGSADTAKACADSLLALQGIEKTFSPQVSAQAQAISQRGIQPEDLEGRADLREEIIFTIDGADSLDLDDAVSLHPLPEGGWQLGVHIADVSHYVTPGTVLDNEAFHRGTSIYYADQVIPMLPKELSNGICSLNPGEDRLAFSAILTLDEHGELTDYFFQKSVIRSRVKGVYSEVNDILENTASPEILEKYKEVIPTLEMMHQVAKLREKIKRRRGAPEIETHEGKLILDENGKCVDVKLYQTGISQGMIEEFMLLANEACAATGRKLELPFVYRIHQPPTADKLEDLNMVLKSLQVPGHNLKPGVPPGALAEILRSVKDKPVFPIVNIQLLRSMSKACYDTNPVGHYGLALKDYAHFTSPIRRYPDLAVHRILSKALAGEDRHHLRDEFYTFTQQAASHSSAAEVTAMRLERDCDDFYKAEYMTGHLGETFDGIISGAAPYGIYVELPNTVEGLVRVEDLIPEGEYRYDGMFTYTEVHGRGQYRVGDPIRVQCAKAEVSSGNVDFKPVKK